MLPPRLVTAGIALLCCAQLLSAQGSASIPMPVDFNLPEYPVDLLKNGETGVIEIKVRVLATGEIQKVETRDVRGKRLAAVCKPIVERWTFKPAGFMGRRTDGVFLAWLQFKDGKTSLVLNYDDSGKWSRPKVTSQVPPKFPYPSSRTADQGRVTVSFIVDWKGSAEDLSVLEATSPDFVQPALDAVSQWRFAPATLDGKPVSARLTVPIVFTMDNGTPPPKNFEVKGNPQESLPEELRYDTPPSAKETVLAVYPYDHAIAREKGTAEIRFLVGPDGNVIGTAVVKASKPEFGLALAAAMEAWKFLPALRNGKPGKALLNKSLGFKPGDANVSLDSDAEALATRLRRGKFTPTKPNELDAPLHPRVGIPPVFPTALVGRENEGTAVIEVIVDKKGRAVLPRIVKASAPEFGWAAATAAQRWLFDPPTVKGEPVEVVVQIPFAFGAPKADAPAAN